jgi:hypothetical protein
LDELNLFRDFRRGVAAPSEASQRQAFAQLTSAIEGQHARRPAVPRLIRQRPGRYALAFAALAGATLAALFVSTPWKSSPGFLERAQAALTPPAGTVLHMKWQSTTSAAEYSCTVTHPASEMWIDQIPPRRYRGRVGYVPPLSQDPRTVACGSAGPVEVGGTLDTQETGPIGPSDQPRYGGPPDLVAALRGAISDGRAHDEGETELGGRTVRRIRVDPPDDCFVPGCERDRIYMYVDPETFRPVQAESSGADFVLLDGTVVRRDGVTRYLTYEYLPGTPANRALADIRKNPIATGP